MHRTKVEQTAGAVKDTVSPSDEAKAFLAGRQGKESAAINGVRQDLGTPFDAYAKAGR